MAASATHSTTHAAIDAVWRIESAKVIAGLARMVRDVGLAEELAQEAHLAALETWPGTGVPDNPGAWLMATAKNRALDHFRRGKLLERKHEELAGEMELAQEMAATDREAALIERMDDDIGDDLLRLVFVACHPVLSTEARAALTLRLRSRSRPHRAHGRRHRRRPAAPRLRRLPSGALDRGARRTHAAPALRPHDRRDRARLPRPGADHRAAHRAREAHPRRDARPLRGAAQGRARRAARIRARGRLPRLQRRLLGDRGRGLDAARALRGGAAPRAHPRRARPA